MNDQSLKNCILKNDQFQGKTEVNDISVLHNKLCRQCVELNLMKLETSKSKSYNQSAIYNKPC